MHPHYHFPYIALLVMGAITAIGSFFNLTIVINILLAVSVLAQSVAQVVGLTVLRRRQPDLRRPYRQWLYPVPSLIALAGWLYVYFSSGALPIILSLVWIAADVFASTDVRARSLVDEVLTELAVHIANISILIDPARIAIGGRLMGSSERILAALSSRLRSAVPFPPELVAARLYMTRL